MEISIPVQNQLDLFKKWLRFLNPILGLREETELTVLASFILFAYNYREYDPSVLNSLLFSEDTRNAIRNRLGLSERSFDKAFKSLLQKGLIEASGENETPSNINPRVIPKDFNITIKFSYERANNNNGV